MRTWFKRLTFVGLALAMAWVLTAFPAQAQSDGAADFSWSMPNRFGKFVGNTRVLDYPQSAAKVETGPFDVDFTLPEAACEPGVRRRFSVGTTTLPEQRLGQACIFRISFEREGGYDVRLDVEGAGLDDSSTQHVVVQDVLIVSIGDSVASGEGNPNNRNFSNPVWQDDRCHRSALAGTARAAGIIEAADPRSSVTFVHLACSGATVPAGLTGGYKGVQRFRLLRPKLPPQLSELNLIFRKREEIDAVLLSVGANDLGFAKIVTFCAHKPRCYEKRIDAKKLGLPPSGPKVVMSAGVTLALGQLRGRYDEVASRLRDVVPADRVFAVEYFDPLHASADSLCDHLMPFVKKDEISWAYDSVLAPLNAQLRDASNRHKWTYVSGVVDAFAGHGYCTRERWVRRLAESFWQQGLNPSGTLHPSEDGHLQTSELLAAALRRALLPAGGDVEPAEPEADSDEEDEELLDAGVVPASLATDGDAGGGDGAPWWVVAACALVLVSVVAAMAFLTPPSGGAPA